jgi:hypothetical protein
MAITVTTDTIVKLIVRSGTNSDRVGIILSQGELGYATDTRRLFVGDGLTAGGRAVGTTNYGFVPPNTLTQNASSTVGVQVGDIISDGTTIYTYSSATGWVAASFNPSVQFDNQTIIQLAGKWQLNNSYLSGGSAYVAAISAVEALSGSWSCSNLLYLPPNSTLANSLCNSTSYAQPLTLSPGQFVGNSNSTLGAINICGCGGLQTNGALANTFYVDGSPLQTQINNLATTVATATGDIADIGTTFYKETSFVYSINTAYGTTGLINMWQNIFADQSCAPLRVAVTTGSRSRVVRVDARVNYHSLYHYSQIYTRLGTFPTLIPTFEDMTTWRSVNGAFPLLATPFTAYTPSTVPTTVLDVTVVGGPYAEWSSQPAYLNAYYTIPANTTVIFGVQSFIQGQASEANNYAMVEINGWASGNYNDGYNPGGTSTRNQVGFTSNVNNNGNPTNLPAYEGWYAWGQPPTKINNVYLYNGAPGSSVAFPQTKHGIANTSDTTPFLDAVGSKNTNNQYYAGVKNTSFIRAVFVS